MTPLIGHYRRLPLRAKFALWVSAGVLAVVVVLMLATLVALEQTARSSVTQIQAALVEGVVRDLDGKLQFRRDALTMSATALGERMPVQESAAVDDFFGSHRLLLRSFDRVLLVDPDGQIVYDSLAKPGDTRPAISTRPYFRQVMATGAFVISPPLFAKIDGRPVLQFAAPVKNRELRTVGVMVGLLRLDEANFLVDLGRLRIGDSGYFVLNTRGPAPVVVAHPHRERILQAAAAGNSASEDAASGTPAARKDALAVAAGTDANVDSVGIDVDGTPSLVTRRALSAAPWTVEAVYPTAEAFAGLRERERQVVGVAALAACISWMLVWHLASHLLAPMDKLRRALQLDATGSDELLGAIRADSTDLAALIDAYYAQKRRRIATETALEANERRLLAITDNLPAMIACVDRSETYSFANVHFRSAMGIEPTALVGQTKMQFHGEDAHAQLRPHIEAALRGEHRKFERTGWKQNADTHFLVEYVPEFDADGSVAGFLIMAFDITERRQAELALARSEKRIRTITDHLPALISHFDRDLRYTFANARVGQEFGCEVSRLIGRPLREVRGDTVFAAVAPCLYRTLAGETVSFETSHHTGDEAEQHFEANYVPEFDASGQVIGVYALTFNVTQRKRGEAALRASQQLLDRTGAIAGVGGWTMELASGAVSWTGQTRRIHEVDDDYAPSVDQAIHFYAPAGRPAIEEAVKRALESQTPWDLVLPFTTAKGHDIWVRATGEVEMLDGKPVRLFGAFQDVTQRVAQEQQLREQAELLQVTLKSIGDGVITTDERGCVRWMNPAAERMTGWTSEAAAGRPSAQVFHVLHADTRAVAPDPVARCLATLDETGPPSRTVLVSASGAEFAVEDSAAPIHDGRGELRGAVLVFHDVSEQRRITDQMTHRATHDALTGLVNRAEFETRLGRVLTKALDETVDHAMMFIDLDQFKLVNDACGHAMGDKLLCQVSELLRASVRNRDTLARLGGDEFGVILEHCTVEQAQRVAQGICDRMEEFRFVHDGRRFRIGASIGLVPIDARWASAAAAQKAADTACYAAKEAGRNRVHTWFDTDSLMHARAGETQWGSRLEEALDDHDFVLFAQRIASIREPSAGLHFEVLIRLREADGTLVAPGRFLPAAERFHMASRIDRWVVRRVFEWLAGEGGSPDDIDTVAVNLSGQSIGDRAFHRFVVELLQEIPVDPKKLCFEVTETSAITNLADATAFIREMRGLGMRVALDDFGAGASSFGYLKNLPVDYLKIDGQFIRDIETDPLDMAAVRCFHEVAKAVGMKTIAEFVETASVLEVLKEIGIDYAQGYLLHRPEPLEDLVRRARGESAALLLNA